MNPSSEHAELLAENRELRARLAEAQDTLNAIRYGEVDALVVSGVDGDQIFTLQGADYPFRVLIESMSEGALILTQDGVIFYANLCLAEMLKVPLEQLIGTPLDPWMTPADRARLQALLEAENQPGLHRIELALTGRDGSAIPCLISFSRLLIAGMPDQFCLVATDLTKQKQMQAALQESEQRMKSIVEFMPVGVWLLDADGDIVFGNAAGRRIWAGELQVRLEQFRDRPRIWRRGWGAGDYSPISADDWAGARAVRRGETTLDEQLEIECFDETCKTILNSAVPIRDGAGRIRGAVVLQQDITERRATEEEIEQLAFYDPLTRLPNRRLLLDRLQQTLEICARSGKQAALLFIDLDNFKVINDTLGHDTGDLLLQQVGQRLRDCVRAEDTVARLGGDEFVVLIKGLSAASDAEAAAQTQEVGDKILAVLNEPYRLAGHDYRSTPSIGATLMRDHRMTIDQILKQADLAMYQAKSAGRNTLRFFDPVMQTTLETRTLLETQLRQGLAEGRFLLYYQPQVDRAGALIGAEALLRWRHPERGLVLPGEFIPLAEETGLILPLGHWVLETACTQLAAWAQHPETACLSLAVNVCARQFRQTDFVDMIRRTLARQPFPPYRLKLELTESLLLTNVEETIATMTALKSMGVSFSLDDFGTGYSSLAYLKRLPLDQIKIDQSFVRDLLSDPSDAAIVRATLAMMDSLGLDVIAEGVETQAQWAFLLEHGCGAFQGYLFGRPAPIEHLPGIG
jgi:diguanylate cyclase (GGDEF)-like protein/PAS domain S-box-containing protein